MDNEFITRHEAATIAGVDVRTIDKWIKVDRKLTAFRVPGRFPVRIKRAELEELVRPRPVAS